MWWWIGGIAAWLACGCVLPICAALEDGIMHVRDLLIAAISIAIGPFGLVFFLDELPDWGDRVLWKRKERPGAARSSR